MRIRASTPQPATSPQPAAQSDGATSHSEDQLRAALAECQVAQDALRHDATHDALTGLPNRVLFLDSLGVRVGDEVIVDHARRLEQCVRSEDMVARLSGDEFAILLESLADDADAGRVAERMLHSLAAPVETREGVIFSTASIGIVLGSSGLDPGDDANICLLQQAGVAMSRAKAAGRARYEMFDRAMQARAVARLRMETDLRTAVERGEFELYYQPMVALETGRVTEIEALLRWNHPTRGIVPPLDFIPLAEETGLIVPIGSWVMADACRQVREWQARFPRDEPLTLSVNLSVKQSERTREMLDELRALGVRMYLDDFGTGYSSLGQLHRLSLDAIKIDRSFVRRMSDGPMHWQLVHTVRNLARNIGVTVIAEGVETAQQLEELRALGCESAQGYLFSRPVPAGEMERMLERDPRW